MRNAFRSVVRRWRRNLLTITAVAVGAGTIVILIVLSQGSALQAIDRLGEYESTQITIGLPAEAWSVDERDLGRNLEDDPDVLGFGTLALPDSGTAAAILQIPANGTSVTATLTIATPHGLALRGVDFESGQMAGSPAVRDADIRSILVGTRIAKELGIAHNSGRRLDVLLNGVQVAVTGIVADNESGAALSASVIMSPETADALGLLPAKRVLIVEVEPGTVDRVAADLALAVFPRDAEAVSIQYAPSPTALRDELTRNARELVTAISGVMVGVTAFTIVTTMQVAVMERRREIGIALALGRRRLSLSAEFLWEATILGAIGALAGTLAGTLVGAAISTYVGWTFVLPPLLLALPVLGLVIGAVAGFWPAHKAGSVDPAELLRSS